MVLIEKAPVSDADPKELEYYAVRRDKALATAVLSVDPSLLYLGRTVPEEVVGQSIELET